MLKIVFCDTSLLYQSYTASEKRIVFMDPTIGWFQPEQCGPALSLWTEIWNTHQRFDNLDINTKVDGKSGETLAVNGNNTFPSEDRKASVKKSDTNCTAENSYSSRVKRKENKASTFGLIRNEDLIINGGTPWRTRGYYSPGLLGYV